MRFLVDAQLPPALAQFLREFGCEAEHVYEVGLIDATDAVIWQAAVTKKAIIVSKDEDFPNRLPFDHNVAIVWIRIGNCSNRVLFEKLRPLIKGIVSRLEQGERLVEVI